MPKTDGDPLGPEFERHLRGQLDRVQPRFSSPRYLAGAGRPALRLAPAVLVLSLVAILGLSAYVATGSPNPVVWTEHVVTVIHPNPASPTPSASPQEQRGGTVATPSQDQNHKTTPEPADRAEPTERPEPAGQPEPAESPEPTDHSGDSSAGHSGDGLSGSSDSGSRSTDPRPGSD